MRLFPGWVWWVGLVVVLVVPSGVGLPLHLEGFPSEGPLWGNGVGTGNCGLGLDGDAVVMGVGEYGVNCGQADMCCFTDYLPCEPAEGGAWCSWSVKPKVRVFRWVDSGSAMGLLEVRGPFTNASPGGEDAGWLCGPVTGVMTWGSQEGFVERHFSLECSMRVFVPSGTCVGAVERVTAWFFSSGSNVPEAHEDVTGTEWC